MSAAMPGAIWPMSSRPSTRAPPRVASAQRFARGSSAAGCEAAHARKQQRLPRLGQQVRRVVGRRAIHAEAHRHARVEHRGAPARCPRRGACSTWGSARRRCRCAAKSSMPAVVELHAVRMPDVLAGPARVVRIFGRRAAEVLARVGDVVVALGEVRVQAHAVGSRERRRLAHEVARHRERRAGRGRDAQHRVRRRIVERLDRRRCVSRRIASSSSTSASGGRPPFDLADAHRAAARVEAQAERRARRRWCRRGGRRSETDTGGRSTWCSRRA